MFRISLFFLLMEQYFVLAYYFFTKVEEPQKEVQRHHAFFQKRDAKGRIYISEQGINGQISASPADADAYMQWMKEDPRFKEIAFKIHRYPEHVFPRMTIKTRKELVALDLSVDMDKRGEYLTPQKWREMLEKKDPETLLLDVRNDYEWEIGHFEGAALPKLEMFREFPDFAQKLKADHPPEKTKVMMYCTGGIRCELYSALLKKEGFEQVYQLEGGIINYGLKEGSSHWRGKLFVFDDRLAVPISEKEPALAISKCSHCQKSSDTYYNCANMDCNALFLSCIDCAEKMQGCCEASCQNAPRLRPFIKTEQPKPFRKWYHYSTQE